MLFDEVCDNIRQCPHGDDEVGCDVTCPIGCSCEGFVFICHQKEVEKFFKDLSVEARKLDLSSSLFPNNNLIPAGVLKQKLARRTKRPESAKLSDRTGRAKVGKTQCESLNMAPLAWSKR